MKQLIVVGISITVMKAGFEIWDYNGVAPSPTEQMRIALRKK